MLHMMASKTRQTNTSHELQLLICRHLMSSVSNLIYFYNSYFISSFISLHYILYHRGDVMYSISL